MNPISRLLYFEISIGLPFNSWTLLLICGAWRSATHTKRHLQPLRNAGHGGLLEAIDKTQLYLALATPQVGPIGPSQKEGDGGGKKVKKLRFATEFEAPGPPQVAWMWLQLITAVREAEMSINILPPGSGPKSAPNPRSPKENDNPDPPPDTPGGRQKQNKQRPSIQLGKQNVFNSDPGS